MLRSLLTESTSTWIDKPTTKPQPHRTAPLCCCHSKWLIIQIKIPFSIHDERVFASLEGEGVLCFSVFFFFGEWRQLPATDEDKLKSMMELIFFFGILQFTHMTFKIKSHYHEKFCGIINKLFLITFLCEISRVSTYLCESYDIIYVNIEEK